jgi:hypothetical protein
MEWQDLVLGAGGIVLGIALIPSLLSEDKPHIGTSLLTSLVLATFAMAYATLELYFAGTVAAITAFGWALLAQQARYRKG